MMRASVLCMLLVAAALSAAAQAPVGAFPDVPRGHWAYPAVESLRQRGILLGYPDGRKRRAGIEGTAVVGPIHPVERPGVPNTRPLAGAVLTFELERGGKEVARTTADTAGRFRAALAPGVYRLVPLPPGGRARYPRGAPQTVRVAAGRYTRVTVEYDSGIR